MVTENGDELYNRVGNAMNGFRKTATTRSSVSRPTSTHRSLLAGALLTDKLAALAKAVRHAKQPLMITECWAIVDYKDWPLLPWEWVKDVCALDTLTAPATRQLAAIATSNFCGPQFRGCGGT